MNKLLTPLSLLLITLFFVGTSVSAQNFNWVKGGGSTQNLSSAYSDEEVKFMCNDVNGNIYALSIVGNSAITADTFHRPTGAFGADNNILISSYKCSGQMRWAKLIASSSASVIPLGMKLDTLGNLYVVGIFPHGNLHIGYDAILPSSNLAAGLMQFDTLGHFNWVRFIGPDTYPNAVASSPGQGTIALDGDQNVHFIKLFKSGSQITGTVTSGYGTYDVVYNPLGVLLDAKELALDSSMTVSAAAIDYHTQRLYVTGEPNSLLGGFNRNFLAEFDINRNLVWIDSLTNPTYTGSGGFGSITIDQIGHLYTTGGGPRSIVYKNDTSFNTLATGSQPVSFIMKTDTLGNVVWMKAFSANSGVNFLEGLTLMPNSKIGATGGMSGDIVCGTDTLRLYASEGQSSFFTIIDTAGYIHTLQQIHGVGFHDAAYATAVDKVGNFYIGGKAENNVWAGSLTPYVSVGGNTDYFIMKYGVDCNCTSMPVANYTDTGSHLIKGFTYTGTSASTIDSIRWEFGDGTTSTAPNPVHTYTMAGTYTVCVTVYTACGSDMRCHKYTVAGAVSVVTTPASTSFADVKIYPNPSKDELNILNVPAPASYRLLTVTGANMLTGSLEIGSNSISIQQLPAGVYILEMVGDGVKNVVRIVKQ